MNSIALINLSGPSFSRKSHCIWTKTQIPGNTNKMRNSRYQILWNRIHKYHWVWPLSHVTIACCNHPCIRDSPITDHRLSIALSALSLSVHRIGVSHQPNGLCLCSFDHPITKSPISHITYRISIRSLLWSPIADYNRNRSSQLLRAQLGFWNRM